MDRAIRGWFKLTTRGAAVAGAPPESDEGGLVPCLDPALPDHQEIAKDWSEATETLHHLLREDPANRALWLDLSRTGPILPSDFFWPGQYKGGLLFVRADDGHLQLETSALRVRLNPGRSANQAIAAMDIGCERLRIERREGGRLRLATDAPRPVSELRYEFQAASEGTKKFEVLKLGSGRHGNTELELAVPLIETAAALRAESGMEERAANFRDDPVGPLWTFTPIENGVLHWPFPDATLEGLETLLELHDLANQAGPAGEPAKGGPVAGAMLLGNEPALAGFDPHDRGWRLSITDGEAGWFELEFERRAGGVAEAAPGQWMLAGAQVAVARCAFSLEGAVPVIPFRQTGERLLPDHDERALRASSLKAVSPSLLRGLEARMWHLANAERRRLRSRTVQARLVVHNFRLVAPQATEPTRLEGKVRLYCTIRSRKPEPEGRRIVPDPALRPWLWTRFDTLPTVQTLPLAVSGEAALHPSGTRELHPLVRAEAATMIEYSFENALDMSRTAPRLVTNVDYVSATDASKSITEIGMAVLTLPSVTIFPGAKGPEDPARLSVAGTSAQWSSTWPVGNGKSDSDGAPEGLPTRIELRHDLAWCDERYAMATAGSPEADETQPRAVFNPRPGNGPQESGGPTSHGAAWEQVERLASLAATDGRELVRREILQGTTKANFLVGFQGKARLRISKLAFSSELEIAEKRLLGAGEVRIEFSADTPGDHPPGDVIVLAGLPGGGDLNGYSGGLGVWRYDFGTLANARKAAADEFTDQRGLSSVGFAPVDGLHRKRVDGLDLYSLSAPLTAGLGASEIRYWFADVPARPLSEPVSPQHWADFAQNHLEGARWAIGPADDVTSRYVHWRSGIYFEPLALSGLSSPDGQPASLTITGRLGLKIGGEFVPQLPEGKQAKLVISWRGDSAATWEIKPEGPFTLRLESAGPDGAPPALLVLPAALGSATLHFDLFGQPASAILELATGSGGGLAFQLPTPTGTAPPVRLGAAYVALSEAGPTVTLDWAFRFESKAGGNLPIVIEGSLADQFYRRDRADPPPGASFKLSVNGAAIAWTTTSENVFYGDGVLALNWASLAVEPGRRMVSESWIALFEDGGFSGALLALIRRKAEAASFTCDDFLLDCEAALAGQLRLRFEARQSVSAKASLHGELERENRAAGEAFTHEVRMRFDGSGVSTVGPKVHVAAHVRHMLKEKPPVVTPRQGELVTVQGATFDTAGGGRVDFTSAFIADGEAGSGALLVVLPGQCPLGVTGGAPVAPPPASCHILPPLTPAPRESARRALARALDVGGVAFSGWADRLRSGGGAFQLSASELVEDGGISKLFDLVDRTGKPIVYSLALPPRWKALADGSAYAAYLKLLSGQLAGTLIAVPPDFLEDRTRRGYVLHGPDVHGERIIELAWEPSVSVAGEVRSGTQPTKWETRLLASTAAWATCGILTTYDEKGAARFRLVDRALAGGDNAGRSGAQRQPDVEPAADPRRVPVPSEDAELSISYVPMAARAVELSYRPAGAGEFEMGEAVLSAHALQRMWQLTGAAAASAPHYRTDHEFWLANRQGVAFRPARIWEALGQRLTPMFADGAALAAAAGMMAATRLAETPGATTSRFAQFFAPAHFILRDISPRPGVWHARRLGLSSVKSSDDVKAPPGKPVAAPELPFHARTPRPPITGVNDRLRASEFEPVAFSLSKEPQFVLYGPRAAPPHAPGPPAAVTRAPLSESGWLGTVVKPERGLIDGRWDGVVRLRIAALSSLAVDPDWIHKSARARMGKQMFELELLPYENPNPDTDRGARFFLIDTKTKRQGKNGAAPDSSFYEHVAGLTLSGRARIECEFELGTDPRLRRHIAFELLVAPRGGAGAERPFSVRFEDPAYNDRLVMPAKFAPQTGGAIFCADRDNVRPDDRLTVAWRRTDAGNEPAVPIEFFLKVVRQIRTADDKVSPVSFPLKSVLASVGAAESWAAIDCAGLKAAPANWAEPAEPEKPPFERLKVNDVLHVSTTDPAGAPPARDPGMALSFEVTLESLFAGNPAAFALLRLDGEAKALSAPLYAQSPAPATVELIDPRDLFNGVARFRASYHWIHFALPVGHLCYAIQKIAGDGGTYLNEDLGAWPKAPSE